MRLLAWSRSVVINDLIDSTDLAGFQPHLDAVRMVSGARQNILYDSARSPSRPLILFLDDPNFKSGFDVFTILAVHFNS
jgi:hypothetical protein